MVKVNIEYNPYLMEFKARFNGKSPRINSLVEKYRTKPARVADSTKAIQGNKYPGMIMELKWDTYE